MKQRTHGNRGLKVTVVLLAMALLVTVVYGYYGISKLKAELDRVQMEYVELSANSEDLNANYQDLDVTYVEVLNYAEQLEKAN